MSKRNCQGEVLTTHRNEATFRFVGRLHRFGSTPMVVTEFEGINFMLLNNHIGVNCARRSRNSNEFNAELKVNHLSGLSNGHRVRVNVCWNSGSDGTGSFTIYRRGKGTVLENCNFKCPCETNFSIRVSVENLDHVKNVFAAFTLKCEFISAYPPYNFS